MAKKRKKYKKYNSKYLRLYGYSIIDCARYTGWSWTSCYNAMQTKRSRELMLYVVKMEEEGK